MAYSYIAKYELPNVYLEVMFIAELEQNLELYIMYYYYLFPTALLSLLN